MKKKQNIKLSEAVTDALLHPPLNRTERFITSLIWGGYPVIYDEVRTDPKFIETTKQFNGGLYQDLYYFETQKL